MADPDWTNPCAVLEWLRPRYYKVLAGEQTIMVVHDGSTVQYGQANRRELASLMRQLTSDCAAASGTRTRRAFMAG
jgi:hypothetical protein